MKRWAEISDCGAYRYVLSREWSPELGANPRSVAFVCLNPSTADANTEDHTSRKMIGFARREGCNRVLTVNLFAYRATNPLDLVRAYQNGIDIVGPATVVHWTNSFMAADVVVVAWGNAPRGIEDAHRRETRRALAMLEAFGKTPMCLGRNGTGEPKHPLYLSARAPLSGYAA